MESIMPVLGRGKFFMVCAVPNGFRSIQVKAFGKMVAHKSGEIRRNPEKSETDLFIANEEKIDLSRFFLSRFFPSVFFSRAGILFAPCIDATCTFTTARGMPEQVT